MTNSHFWGTDSETLHLILDPDEESVVPTYDDEVLAMYLYVYTYCGLKKVSEEKMKFQRLIKDVFQWKHNQVFYGG